MQEKYASRVRRRSSLSRRSSRLLRRSFGQSSKANLVSYAASELYQRYMNLSSVVAVEPLIVNHARGALIWDEDAKEYVDCFGGIAVTNAGHCDPRILEAAREQMGRVVHCGSLLYHIPVVGQTAQRLAEVTPG